MTDNGADENSFLWGINPGDPDDVAAERAAANRLANEQAAGAQAAALAAQRRTPGALAGQNPPAQPAAAPAEPEDDDPFAIFTPPPTEATPLPPEQPPAAPWVPGAFTAQQPIVPPPVTPTPAAPVFPVEAPAPPQGEQPPELVLPPEPKWPLPAQPGAASWDQPTQATPYIDMPTEAYDFEPRPQTYPWDPSSGAIPAPDPALAGLTDPYPAQPVSLPAPEGESVAAEAPTTKLPSTDFDSLFGDDQFKEYDDESLLSPLIPGKTDAPPPPVLPRAPLTSTQRTLIWVAGGLVAALALVGLFLFGSSLSGPAEILPPVTQETPGAEDPAETPAVVVGPVAPGVYAWDELLGTECLDPFESAWQQEYTVVDCGTPHAAQMLSTGVFDDDEDADGSEFPGVEELVTRATETCEDRDIINYGKASKFTDLRLSASVPANAELWASGERAYSCFATRDSGDPMTDTITKTLKAD